MCSYLQIQVLSLPSACTQVEDFIRMWLQAVGASLTAQKFAKSEVGGYW